MKMKNTRAEEAQTKNLYCQQRFIHFINLYLLNAYFVPGGIPSTQDSVVNKQNFFFHGAHI